MVDTYISVEFTPDELTILFNIISRQPYLLGDARLVDPILEKIIAKRPPVKEEKNGSVQSAKS